MGYTCFISLIGENKPTTIDITYNVNLFNTVIRGVNSALCDRNAYGCIKDNDMRLLSYNNDRRRISVGIAGNNQLIGA